MILETREYNRLTSAIRSTYCIRGGKHLHMRYKTQPPMQCLEIKVKGYLCSTEDVKNYLLDKTHQVEFYGKEANKKKKPFLYWRKDFRKWGVVVYEDGKQTQIGLYRNKKDANKRLKEWLNPLITDDWNEDDEKYKIFEYCNYCGEPLEGWDKQCGAANHLKCWENKMFEERIEKAKNEDKTLIFEE